MCTRYQRGGSERRLRDSIRALPEVRHHVLLGADSDVELAREQTGADRVWVLPTLVRQVDPVRDVAALVSLWRLLRGSDYPVVVSHQSKAGVLARLAAVATGGPATVHSLSMASFGPGYGRVENALFPRLERALGRRTAAYCVVGHDLARRYRGIGVPPDRLQVVRSGVPLPSRLRPREEARNLLDARHGTPRGRRLICYVGSLEPRKNPLLLADLLRGLHDRAASEGPCLLVVGDGPERGRLGARLEDLGMARHAVLTGHLADPEDVFDALRGADLVVLLSATEGLPQVLVQAAAAGTPFVAHDVEGVREVLALGARGSAVPPGRLGDVVAAAERWLVAAPAGDREPVTDLSSWSERSIAASYRSVFEPLLGTAPPARRPAGAVSATA
ncbi:glycosyltransferase [Geodermatophilus sp. SYSU D01036]